MMFIILTILLPMAQPLSEECQALDVQVVKPGNLTEPVKEQLEKLIGKNLSDGLAAYYIGIPDPLNSELQFTAICASGSGLPQVPFCLNVTWVNGEFNGTRIPEEQFLDFYKKCSNDLELKLSKNISNASEN